MRSGFATLAVVGVAACVAVYALSGSAPESKSLYSMAADDFEFLKYVSKYGKSYGTKEEFEYRAANFKNVLEKLSEENSKNDNSFTVSINKFADWSHEEYKRLLSYKAVPKNFVSEAETTNVSIPDSVDWRSQGKVNKVKDQGQCGSCWAFSAVGAMESRFAIKSGTLLSLSEQQLVDCANGKEWPNSSGCEGGEMYEGIDYAGVKGLELETDYPYTATDQTCQYNAAKATHAKPVGNHYDHVATNNAQALLTAIADGPVSVAIEADTFVFQFYSGGVLNSKNCGTNLDHGVVAVGYGNDASKGKYYIVRNSWGASWGDAGYVKIAVVDGPGICGIQMDAVYPLY
jgi:cathepsin L/cathepsin H